MISKLNKWIREVRKGARAAQVTEKLVRQNTMHSVEMLQSLGRLEKQKSAIKPKRPIVEFSRLDTNGSSCPVCDAANGVMWASAYPSDSARFRMSIVLYCVECGSGYVPDAERVLDEYYAYEYASTNRQDRDIDPESYFRPDNQKIAAYFSRARDQIRLLQQHGADFGAVLDYGSGPGYFLHECKARKPFAVELDESSHKYLDYLGAQRVLPEELPRGAFDVIVASHVVEHFTARTLVANLKEMAGALKPSGRLLVEVPHGGHTYLKLGRRQEPHTLFFTPEGLELALKRSGLDVLAAVARGHTVMEGRENPIYTPTPSRSRFDSHHHGGLTIVAQRSLLAEG